MQFAAESSTDNLTSSMRFASSYVSHPLFDYYGFPRIRSSSGKSWEINANAPLSFLQGLVAHLALVAANSFKKEDWYWRLPQIDAPTFFGDVKFNKCGQNVGSRAVTQQLLDDGTLSRTN